MNDDLHRHVSAIAIEGKKISLVPGRLNRFTILNDEGSVISFTLKKKDGGGVVLDKHPFALSGQGLKISDETDSRGMYRHAPAQSGEYQVEVDGEKFKVPARSKDAPPCELLVTNEKKSADNSKE